MLDVRVWWSLAAVMATTAGPVAQNTGGLIAGAADRPTPAFEVASVKPNRTSSTAMTIQWTPDGRFRATNVPLQTLITVAFSLRSRDQILNAPSWTAVERFDIDGRPSADIPRAQHVLLLQALLSERFALVVRPVASELPVYVLARRRGDNAALPRGMRESTRRCEETAGPAAADSKQVASSRADCFLRGDARGGRITALGARMAALVFQLSGMLGAKVIDQTGLPGRYDFEVVAPEAASNVQSDDLVARQAWLIAAVESQLGLDLRRETAPASSVYVERVDRPTPN